ncbi:MAG: two-component system chemotaxis response regulator CheB [Cognaticolwellia sp.]|jgi:two-component system chemotaxis response regulator CheB
MSVRVLIVDDSIVAREVLKRALARAPGIEVIGTARDVYEARDQIVALQPDVMTLDIEMPKMNGVEFLRRLIPQHDLPTVVVTSHQSRRSEALEAGARRVVVKPSAHLVGNTTEAMLAELVSCIMAIGPGSAALSGYSPMSEGLPGRSVVAIGASTGGTEAIKSLLMSLPKDLPPVLVVQHMPAGFTTSFAARLNNECQLQVEEARDGDRLRRGRVYLAPGGQHMRIRGGPGSFELSVRDGDKVSGHRPSVDVLFRSVALAAKGKAMGILLTGMGRDGAQGLLSMSQAGCATVAQDEASSVVWGMPRVAWELGAAKELLPIGHMGRKVISWQRGAAGRTIYGELPV